MGYSSTRSFDFHSYSSTASAAAKSTVHDAFKSRDMKDYMDPSKFTLRESRNSLNNPKSTPIIVGLDVTGSMGNIPHSLLSGGLGTMLKEIIERQPVSDPHLMMMAIGDVKYDRAPLQASQFETDLKIVEQLQDIYVEGNGGGNGFESYNLPWHFAAFHTSCDAFEKDGRKGFIFTLGDEEVPDDLTEADLRKVYGRGQEVVATNEQLLQILADKYHVFHLMIAQGAHMRHRGDKVRDEWKALLGQRALEVSDYTKIPEIIISTMQVIGGKDAATVAKSWSGDTSLVVSKAIGGLSPVTTNTGGLVRL